MITKRLLRNVSPLLIYQAALERGLECRIESSRFNLFSIMIHRRRIFIRGTSLPVNSQSACSISNNKYLSKKIFKQNGIAVPKSWLVKSVKEARKCILKNNLFPCVVKPISGSHGNEIYANIENIDELNDVLNEFSKTEHRDILIEEHIPGSDNRVLVVGNKVSAVVERIPAHVIGDGKSSIKELIKKFNSNSLVGEKYEKPLCKIRINFELIRSLRKVHLKTTSVVKKNRVVTLKQTANISVGGISKDVTDIVPDETKETALRAARALGMNFCGVDIIYNPEKRKSYVLEVNDSPGIDIHHYPVIGDRQDVATDIIDYIVSTEEKFQDSLEVSTNGAIKFFD